MPKFLTVLCDVRRQLVHVIWPALSLGKIRFRLLCSRGYRLGVLGNICGLGKVDSLRLACRRIFSRNIHRTLSASAFLVYGVHKLAPPSMPATLGGPPQWPIPVFLLLTALLMDASIRCLRPARYNDILDSRAILDRWLDSLLTGEGIGRPFLGALLYFFSLVSFSIFVIALTRLIYA